LACIFTRGKRGLFAGCSQAKKTRKEKRGGKEKGGGRRD